MKLQHITGCLYKGAQAVPASFLGSIARACKELHCVHPVLVTCWTWQAALGSAFGRLFGLACGRLIP